MDSLKSTAGEIGRESDVAAVEERINDAMSNLAQLSQLADKTRRDYDARQARTNKIAVDRARLSEWLDAVEARLNDGVLADRPTLALEMLQEQKSELERLKSAWKDYEPKITAMFDLLKFSGNGESPVYGNAF